MGKLLCPQIHGTKSNYDTTLTLIFRVHLEEGLGYEIISIMINLVLVLS